MTRSVEGTTTSVARRRESLTCSLEPGHAGLHRDLSFGEEWERRTSERPSAYPTVLRHEDDEPGSG